MPKKSKKRTMKRRSTGDMWLVITIAFVILGTWATFSAYVWYYVSKTEYEWMGHAADIFGWINSFFSGLALAGVVAALIFQMRELRKMDSEFRSDRIDRVLELFLTFRDDRLHEARLKAWKARGRWYKDPSYRKYQINSYFGEKENGRDDEQELAEQRRAIYDLLEFYGILAHCPGPEDILFKFDFYYYSWRGFLNEYIEEHEKKYAEVVDTEAKRRQMPISKWRANIGRLEERLGCPKYVGSEHPLDSILVLAKDAGDIHA